MTSHLTASELADAAEGSLAVPRQAHLERCDDCAREVRSLVAVLREAADLGVPEPSPLFWEHLSGRVRAAIAAEPVPGGGWADWLRWPVLAPIGAIALVVLAMVIAVPWPLSEPSRRAAAVPPPSEGVALSDEGWSLVSEMVGEFDWETASAAGLAVEPGDAERALLELSAQEQQELRRLLTAELERAKS